MRYFKSKKITGFADADPAISILDKFVAAGYFVYA